jgi:hypothetical protein
MVKDLELIKVLVLLYMRNKQVGTCDAGEHALNEPSSRFL